MTIVLAALLLLFLVPCSFGVRGFHVDRYIGRDEIQPVKGLFLILVFASHFCQYVTLGGGLDAGYLNTRKFLGQMIVVPFLFYSGYGVVASIRRKGETYLLSMPVQRMIIRDPAFRLSASFRRQIRERANTSGFRWKRASEGDILRLRCALQGKSCMFLNT